MIVDIHNNNEGVSSQVHVYYTIYMYGVVKTY